MTPVDRLQATGETLCWTEPRNPGHFEPEVRRVEVRWMKRGGFLRRRLQADGVIWDTQQDLAWLRDRLAHDPPALTWRRRGLLTGVGVATGS